jgi:hypothetical protein
MIVAAALWLSLTLVGYWAYWNFHRPHSVVAFRYGVTRRRYILAVSCYVAVALGIFLAVLVLLLLLKRMLPYPFTGRLSTDVSLLAALLVTILLPHLPYTRDVLALVRAAAQRLALFPDEARALLARLCSGPPPDEESRAALRHAIACYGLTEDALDELLPPAVVAQVEVTSALHIRFFAQIAGEPRLRAFAAARAPELEHARAEYALLLRRVARALVLAQEVKEATGRGTAPPTDEEVDAPDFSKIAEFIADESVAAAAPTRALLAEAALSAFGRPAERAAFLARFGFAIGQEDDLPFNAILGILAVAPATAMLGFAPLTLRWFGVPPPPEMGNITPGEAAAFSLIFAGQQLLVVLWAVLPKALTRFGRPTPHHLPWVSYLVTGLGTYAMNLGLRLLLPLLGLQPPEIPVNPMLLILVTSIFGPVVAVTLAVQIDLKLKDRTYHFQQGRWWDAALLGCAILLTDLLVQAALAGLGGWTFKPQFTVLMAALGAVTGFLVPWVVAAYLQERQRSMAETTLLPRIGQALSAMAEELSPPGHAALPESHPRPSVLRRLVIRD